MHSALLSGRALGGGPEIRPALLTNTERPSNSPDGGSITEGQQPKREQYAVNRSRAADDFATIRARMEELRREREGTKPSEKEAQRDALLPRGGTIRWPPEISAGPGRVR